MTYKKKFLNKSGISSPISGVNSNSGAWNGSPGQNGSPTYGWNNQEFGYKNYMSRLPEVYTGHPNRIERYNQYEMMDVDAEINACLDIIAEFSTQENEHNKTPFNIGFTEEPTPHEVEILQKQLQQWCKLNEFDTRAFKIFRNTIKYGDQVFVRDPENFKLYWVDMTKVIKVIVNESEGKKPEQYVLKDLNINLQDLTVAQKTNTDFAANPATGLGGTGGGANTNGYTVPSMPYNTTGSRFTLGQSESAIDAKHIVHLSLTEGLDRFWPFGQSILENVFKVYKQKELLEDAVLIYRVNRAPERRMFKIDVGNMPSHMAMAFVERVKNEIHQRRIPSNYGGSSILDATYNPLSINEDYFFPVTADGRGSTVEMLQGGCFSMDTKIPLLDGRILSIAEISAELSDGKKLWVYSCEPKTGLVVPGLVSWAGVTRKSAQVMKLTLDNGEEIICTPDHKFPQYGEDFKRADQFNVGDSLIPLYRKNEYISETTKLDYEQYFDNHEKQWIYTHRMVADTFRGSLCEYHIHESTVSNGEYEVRHHKNFNRYDNSPSNLCWMSWIDHKKLHQDYGFTPEAQRLGTVAALAKLEYLKENDPDAYKKFCQENGDRLKIWRKNLSAEEKSELYARVSTSLSNYIQNLSPADKSVRDKISVDGFRKASRVKLERMQQDPLFREWVCKQQSLGWTDELRSNRSEFMIERNKKDWENNTERRAKLSDSQRVEYSHDMLRKVIDLVKGKTTHEVTLDDVVANLNSDLTLREELSNLNHNKQVRNWTIERGFTKGGIGSLIRQFGYTSWSEFRRKESVHNHRIVAIEYLSDPIEVGTLTIDGDEIYHDYHTFALAAGVFTKNSNLGEIDDLRYFNNRLARGLRVPSSYLPTGPEDSERVLVDGKVGNALIQEYRFNQYCERLQKYISHKLDEEFKLFLRWRGFNIDSGLFALQFNPPQNFAAYRQTELDTARINSFQTIQQFPYISKRFALTRFLGLSEEEVTKNERMWREENNKEESFKPTGSDLRSVGISVGDFDADQSTAEELEAGTEGMEGEEGLETPAPEIAGPVASPAPVATPGTPPAAPTL